MTSALIGHVDLDCFFAAAETVRRPELRGLCVAVGGAGPRGVIATASYEARHFGVRSAMRTSEALRRCPDLIVLDPDFAWYRELSFEVLATLVGYSTALEPASLDEAYLLFEPSITYDTLPALAKELRAEVRARTGLAASFGAGPSRGVAKLASDAAKPDGIRVVTPEQATRFLAEHRLSDLPGLGPSTVERLTSFGVTSVTNLAALDDDVATRFLGSSGIHLRDLARGHDGTSVAPRSAPSSVGSEETLTQDLRTREEFVSAVDRISREALRRLARLAMGASGVTLKVRNAAFADTSRSVSVGPPTNDPRVLRRALRTLCDPLFDQAGAVRLVGVTFTGLSDSVQTRLDLEGPSSGWSLQRAPRTGEPVRHATFGSGHVVVGDPDTAVVRFLDRVRVIDDPKRHLTIEESTTA